ncbi:MAG: 50S ribosomal protein L29 [Deltaproteobacteria bacterium]|nr:50S ribosomal protein L29 [Deltaproteobacteria bacterium]
MKIKDIRDLSNDELNQKHKELSEELFNLRIRHTSGQLESPAMMGKVKKDIARINTVLKQRGIPEHA